LKVFTAVSLAPGTTPPLESFTVPESVPPDTAQAMLAEKRTSAAVPRE
jgi:hypothetical protein